jgi:hypothetical protein
MYPTSKRKWMAAVLVVLFWVFFSPAQAHAHGGGHGGGSGHGGGGGGARGGGGHYAGGFHVSSGRPGYSGIGSRLSGPEVTQAHLIVDSPGFPEDLPEARIHRFLQQHLLHPHLPHWLNG